MARLAVVLVVLGGVVAATELTPDKDATLARFCADCHAGDDPEGGFGLADLEFVDGSELWWSVAARLADHSMPPAKAEQLSEAERTEVLAWIDEQHPRPVATLADIPAPPIRRYNRIELLNILGELFGVRLDAERLMSDEVGDGFDTHAGVLTWSELALEKWVELVEQVAHDSVRSAGSFQFARRVVQHETWTTHGGAVRLRQRDVALFTRGDVTQTIDVPAGGAYRIEVETRGTRGGEDLPVLQMRSSDRLLAEFEVAAVEDWEVAQHVVELPAGGFKLKLEFPNDYSSDDEDRNLFIREVALVGPLDDPVLSGFQSRFLGADATSARSVIADFLPVVWRRPVLKRDVHSLLKLTSSSDELAQRVRTALIAALISPRFHTLGLGQMEAPDFALADRLAVLLWKAAPDERLLTRAADGSLHQPDVLIGELQRLLLDVRASEFAADFATQWLQLRGLGDSMPDAQLFPDFDEDLARSMRRESELFFEAVLRERRPVQDLLLGDFAFLNARLAKHYGIEAGPGSSEFRRVRLDSAQRSGVLSQAAVLTATSNATRTSPVLRGKWIMDAILDTPPAPPPADAANLAPIPPGASAASLRERLEAHREDVACAACHATMDQLGFALENFDATGVWRTRDAGLPVDTRGELPDGRSFSNVRDLAEVLCQGDAFLRAFTRRLSTYALGRSLVEADELWLSPLIAEWDPTQVTVVEVLEGIVTSPAFCPQPIR